MRRVIKGGKVGDEESNKRGKVGDGESNKRGERGGGGPVLQFAQFLCCKEAGVCVFREAGGNYCKEGGFGCPGVGAGVLHGRFWKQAVFLIVCFD